MVLVNNELAKSFKKLPLASWQALAVSTPFYQLFPGTFILKGLDVKMAAESFITSINLKRDFA